MDSFDLMRLVESGEQMVLSSGPQANKKGEAQL